LLLAAGLLLALSAPATASTAPAADGMLAQGRHRLAIKLYGRALERNPDDAGLRLGRARAQAQIGWCAEATPVLLELQDSDDFDLRAALDLGRCLADELRYDEALAVLEDAGHYADSGSDIAVERAWVAMLAGDAALVEHLANDAEAASPASPATWLLQAEHAWLVGDFPAMNAALDALNAEQPRAWRADLLRAWEALDVGDTAEATAWLRGPSRVNRMQLPLVGSWLAEANRRLGQPELGRKILEGQAGEHNPGAARLALRLRLDADLGDLAAARAALAPLLVAHPLDPQVLATAWYLAVRAGDADEAAALAARYDRVLPPGRAPLHHLLPPDLLLLHPEQP